jgi:branched-chain amino acid transport system substrate-binding protein
MMPNRRALALLAFCGLLAAGPPLASPLSAASPGVAADRIIFGQSAALEGPAAALGREMRRGILAAFEEVNAAGGVAGRKLELVSYDDGYEPERAIDNTQQLIDQDQVFALIGAVGTPTSAAAAPIAVAEGVPFIGPFTGAQFLRDPALTTVVNVRASYFQETERITAWLADEQGIDRIAVLYQDDSFGRAGLQGMRQALARRGLEVVSLGVYPRNTTAVKRALLAIRQGAPRAVVIVGTYAPSAAFTLWARKLGLSVLFMNLSFVGSHALAEALDGSAVADTYISQVVPPPDGDSLPLQAQYRAAIGDAEPSFISLEGYIAGRLAIAVLQGIEGEPTREAFLAALQRIGSFDLGGFSLRYGAGDNQGSDAVFLTAIEADGRIVAVEGRP